MEHAPSFLFLLFGFLLTGQKLQGQGEDEPLSPPLPSVSAEIQRADKESEETSFLVLPTASSHEEVKRHLSLGWQDLLLGWEESARYHLNIALKNDARCALAHAGLMMLPSSSGTEEHLQVLKEQCDQTDSPTLTPAEISYLSIFLKAAGRGLSEAGREMCLYADRYRADLFAALWSLQLLHYADAPYTPEGKPSPLQQEALQRADLLFQAQPSHPLVCYVRASLEETAPLVSPQALEAAQRCTKIMPWHPMPELLLGHLLYRSGRERESLEHFQRAASLAQQRLPLESESCSALVLTARLYEATALWSIGRDRESLQLRRRLCAFPLPASDASSAEAPATLLRWEVRTLPLRLLVLRKEIPTQGEIDAAYRAATPNVPSSCDLVLEERNCLRAALSARRKAHAGDMKEAIRSLKLAEEALARFEDTLPQARQISVGWETPWYRAQEACLIAVYAAKAEVYPSSAEIWRENLQRAIHEPLFLMPPAIPQRSAAQEKDSSQINRSSSSSQTSSPTSSRKKAKVGKKASQEKGTSPRTTRSKQRKR